MARFLTTPQITLASSLGILILRLKLEVELKIIKELDKIRRELSLSGCEDVGKLRTFKIKVSNIRDLVNKIQSRTSRFEKTIDSLSNISRIISGAVITLELLPIPNVGTTIGVTNKSADLLNKFKKLSNEIHDEVLIITGLLNGTNGVVTLLNRTKPTLEFIDTFIKNCLEGNPNLSEDLLNPLDQQLSNFVEDYLGYRIQVDTVDTSQVAPLRQAIAKDRLGIIRFSSERSFSASTEVLVKEVKFKIDNNILT